jgi:hypothetical protein
MKRQEGDQIKTSYLLLATQDKPPPAERGVTINLWLSEREGEGTGPQRQKEKKT